MQNNRALFIGRFQPFHNGHLNVIKTLLENHKEVVVVIGSAQEENTAENPFSAAVRLEMIKSCFSKSDLARLVIIQINDIKDNHKWVEHVLKHTPKFDIPRSGVPISSHNRSNDYVVYSNNELVRELFLKEGFIVQATRIFDREVHAGEEIRKLILSNGNWERFVPESVEKIIKQKNKYDL
ncbi:MAG: nicotinamide-nucleotide adenylyltransferase [Candidatus Micrarchaeota archaeon]